MLIGVALNVSLQWVPDVHGLGWRIAVLAAGVVLGGVATGMYIGAHYGPGPRDGLMTGLARRTGRSIRLVRTGLEVTVLLVGWALGGTVGVGTVVYALAIGPLAQLFLPIFDVDRVRPRPPVAATSVLAPLRRDTPCASPQRGQDPEVRGASRRPRRRGRARWPAARSAPRTRD